MGQTYFVKLKTGFLDRESAAAALREKIGRAEKEYVNYNLDHYRNELGIGTDRCARRRIRPMPGFCLKINNLTQGDAFPPMTEVTGVHA